MRSELCACGDWIVAREVDTEILGAVRAHNAGTAHRLWRARRRRVERTREWRARVRAELELMRLRRWLDAARVSVGQWSTGGSGCLHDAAVGSGTKHLGPAGRLA